MNEELKYYISICEEYGIDEESMELYAYNDTILNEESYSEYVSKCKSKGVTPKSEEDFLKSKERIKKILGVAATAATVGATAIAGNKYAKSKGYKGIKDMAHKKGLERKRANKKAERLGARDARREAREERREARREERDARRRARAERREIRNQERYDTGRGPLRWYTNRAERDRMRQDFRDLRHLDYEGRYNSARRGMQFENEKDRILKNRELKDLMANDNTKQFNLNMNSRKAINDYAASRRPENYDSLSKKEKQEIDRRINDEIKQVTAGMRNTGADILTESYNLYDLFDNTNLSSYNENFDELENSNYSLYDIFE